MLPLVPYSVTRSDNQWFYHVISGYRQPKPYNVNSPVVIRKAIKTGNAPSSAQSPPNADAFNQLWPNSVTILNNKLYGKFMSELGDQSSFGATLTAEGRQTSSMLAGTVIRIFKAAKAARKLQFQKVAHELGIPYKEKTRKIKRAKVNKDGTLRKVRIYRHKYIETPDGRQFAKTAGGAWLFWSYGVKPLAQDLYNGLDVLNRDPPSVPVKVSVGFDKIYEEYFNQPGYYPTILKWKVKFRGKAGAFVRVTSPNKFLISQFGLTNPASWILEAIPGSFVIDWFSNLSQVVESWMPPSGLAITSPWQSKRYIYDKYQWMGGPYGHAGSLTGVEYERTLTLPSLPRLVFAYEPPSWQRGLNAISLLTGFLSSGRNR